MMWMLGTEQSGQRRRSGWPPPAAYGTPAGWLHSSPPGSYVPETKLRRLRLPGTPAGAFRISDTGSWSRPGSGTRHRLGPTPDTACFGEGSGSTSRTGSRVPRTLCRSPPTPPPMTSTHVFSRDQILVAESLFPALHLPSRRWSTMNVQPLWLHQGANGRRVPAEPNPEHQGAPRCSSDTPDASVAETTTREAARPASGKGGPVGARRLGSAVTAWRAGAMAGGPGTS
jgi:hypothetical protein